jgi:hypothetical protein
MVYNIHKDAYCNTENTVPILNGFLSLNYERYFI